MSKSLGNIIDPIDMIEKYGADATRLSLIIGATPGTDLKLSEERVRGYKHFANKLWNITRFVLTSVEEQKNQNGTLEQNDEKLLKEAHSIAGEVTKDLHEYRLYMAADKLYHYVWHRFADIILEESKPIFRDGTLESKASRARVLYEILLLSLKLLHPFMPFVTEEIWSSLPNQKGTLLMIEKWPV